MIDIQRQKQYLIMVITNKHLSLSPMLRLSGFKNFERDKVVSGINCQN